MGKHRDRTDRNRSKTLPSSPTHSFSSSSSSDFEFTIAVSPRKSSAALCPADELFYKGQLLPLHLSPRISMVRTLLLSSSSTSSSATASRDSTGSTSSTDSSTSSFASDLALLAAGVDATCESSRPSSVAEDDSGAGDLTRKLNPNNKSSTTKPASRNYFSLSRFSNVFKKDPKSAVRDPEQSGSGPVKRTSSSSSSSAKEMFRKYLKKVKPFYEKLSHKQQQQSSAVTTSSGTSSSNTAPFCSKSSSINRSTAAPGVDQEITVASRGNNGNYSGNLSHSFSGNLGYPRRTRRSCVASCPSSMRSSPSHSGVLSRTGFTARAGGGGATASFYSDNSTMEELQSAIQGAIAHCKNSMIQSNKASTSSSVRVGVSNEI